LTNEEKLVSFIGAGNQLPYDTTPTAPWFIIEKFEDPKYICGRSVDFSGYSGLFMSRSVMDLMNQVASS
jgi:hypothetical protein